MKLHACLFPREEISDIFITRWQLSLEPHGQFQQNIAQSSLLWRRFKFIQLKGHILSKLEIGATYWRNTETSSELQGQFQSILAQVHTYKDQFILKSEKMYLDHIPVVVYAFAFNSLKISFDSENHYFRLVFQTNWLRKCPPTNSSCSYSMRSLCMCFPQSAL